MPPDPVLQVRQFACRALELAGPVHDAALFVLMESEHMQKGGQLFRWFSVGSLNVPSVTVPLRDWSITLNVAIRILRQHRLILPAGGAGRYRASVDGDIVKHTFNNLRDFAIGKYFSEPLSGTQKRRIEKLKSVMHGVCQETLRDRQHLS